MNRRCDLCDNYQPTGRAFRPATGASDDCGECHAGPPTIADENGQRWPLAFADEWCACFAPKPDEWPATLPFPADRVTNVPLDLGRGDDMPVVLKFPGARGNLPGGGA